MGRCSCGAATNIRTTSLPVQNRKTVNIGNTLIHGCMKSKRLSPLPGGSLKMKRIPPHCELTMNCGKFDAYVEQVLYYARSTDVEKDFKVEKTTLQALVYAALKTYSKPLIQVGGKPVLKELDIPVAADSKSCTFVIGQILSNAIKYRKDNLQVEFSARAEKNTVSLFISDNGIGISAADLPRVFDKGFTGENGRRYSKSTGIGLYLSQRLCRKMNISLSISSVPGQGTTVTMVFSYGKLFAGGGAVKPRFFQPYILVIQM